MDACCNCGRQFKKRSKSYDRKNIYGNVKCKDVDKTLKDVIEEEFNIKLTPNVKQQRFLCESCSWALVSIAKSNRAKSEAEKKLGSASSSAHYLAKKLRSPAPTPRKIKKQRIFSPPKKRKETQPNSDSNLPRGEKDHSNVQSRKLTSIETDVHRALKLIRCRIYTRGVKMLMNARVGFKTAIHRIVQDNVRAEISKLCQAEHSTFLGGKSLEEISKFDWNPRYEEMAKYCPLLTDCLVGAVAKKNPNNTLTLPSRKGVSAKPILGTLMSIMLYTRKPHSFNEFQELNGIQLWLAGCKREVFTRFNHVGLSIGINGTTNALDRIRKHYDKDVLEWKRQITDYLLLPSDLDTSTSATVPFEEMESNGSLSDAPALPLDLSEDVHSPMNGSSKESNRESVLSDEDENGTSIQTSRSEHSGRFGFSLCFDNVNQKTNVRHQTRDSKNKMFNMVQGYAARDRIPTNQLSDVSPLPKDILAIPLSKFLPNDQDETDLQFEMRTVLNRVLTKYIGAFNGLAEDINMHIQHQYSKESSKKSYMIPIGVLDKDESRVADTIDILEEYQKYVPITPTGEPLTTILHADGLSVERGNNAQCARINANNPWQQLQGFNLNIQEWHKRCILLQDIFDELYSSRSGREKGTLCHLKNYFNHRNVTSNVKESFNFNEEFLEFCCEAYIVLAALTFMKISDKDVKPQNFPNDKINQRKYLDNITEQMMDIVFQSCEPVVNKIFMEVDEKYTYPYCFCKTEKPGETMVYCENKNCPNGSWFHLECFQMQESDVPEGKWWCSSECQMSVPKSRKKKTVADNLIDNRRCYAVKVIWYGLNQKVRRDAIRENDGKRIISHWKFDMLNFYEHNHPKYFLVCTQLLAAVGGAVSPRLIQTLIWNRTVNPNGGKGKNIAMDLQMEHYNKAYKESVKDSAGQLTEATIARHSQMVGVGKALRQVYEKQVSGLNRSQVQSTTTADRNNDIKEFINLMINEDIFTNIPGRSSLSFPDMTLCIYKNIQTKNFRSRLIRIRKEIAKRREIVLQMQNT